MGLGGRIRELRKNRGLTLTQLSQRSKVSKAYLSQLENEQFSNPTTDILLKLCSVLRVSVDTILDLEGSTAVQADFFEVPAQLRAIVKEEELNDDDIAMLSKISYRGKQPNSTDGWRSVIKAIRKSTGNSDNI